MRSILPEIVKGDELDGLVSFATIRISWPDNSVSRIGIELDCPWDEEHGMGIVIANGVVKRVGDAATAITAMTPERQGGHSQ